MSIYKNEVEKPSMPSEGRMESGEGCASFKSQADSIAMGQSGEAGYKADQKRLASQAKHYGWD